MDGSHLNTSVMNKCFVLQDGESKSFILTLTWGSTYPVVDLPEISLDGFYNRHLLQSVKDSIKQVT